MALLTSDIVWLVSETVTLPDGTRETVLVPRVYQAVRTGDLDPSGALLAGKNIRIDMSGDVVNSGSIDGKSVTQILAGGDLANLGGRVTGGQAVGLYADRDILNIGGQVKSGGVLVADAGRDLLVTTTVRSDAGGAQPGGVITQAATRIGRVASMEVTGQAGGSGQMSLSAGRDVTLTGAQIVNGSVAGTTTIKAGGDLTLATVSDRGMTDKQIGKASNAAPGGSAGVGSASGSQTSTTKAGISGIAGDATVRSNDTAASTGALVKNWDTTSLIKDVQAQTQITQEFGQRASTAWGTYSNGKLADAIEREDAEAAACWSAKL